MLNKSNEDKIYIKFIIGKIIESKLNKINNYLNNKTKSLDFNYSNIKREFNKYHKGGFYPYDDTLYTRHIFLPADAVFYNNNTSNSSNNTSNNEKINTFNKLSKISLITKENYKPEIENQAIELLDQITESIDKLRNNLQKNNNGENDNGENNNGENNNDNGKNNDEINELLTKLPLILEKFNKKLCNKLAKQHPSIYEKVKDLCKN